MSLEPNVTTQNKPLLPLALAALGIVFGDIGTSPLYALRETLQGLPITTANVLGVLSLIFWSLILIISVKYLLIVFRADNAGEGGTLALLALLRQKKTRHEWVFALIAIFGAGLLIGDGMLTPAISVSSAVEGLVVISDSFEKFVMPLVCFILIGLFAFQSKGTEKIGKAFGPLILIWFLVIAVLGGVQIVKNPIALEAVNPYFAWKFLYGNGWQGYLLLGGVFLVVTGGEALYADIGHFGKNPIRMSWYVLVLPCLLLNYFGQGAYVIMHPGAIENPFYCIAPSWFFIPLILLATIATVIASQAVISATFSLTKQAVLLGFYPKLPIIQTSKEHLGQIYIPQVNFFLMLGSLLLILTFKDASRLTHAYGIAVNLVMLMVSLMVTYAALKVWHWSTLKVIAVIGIFVCIDVIFLGANAHKILTGGWAPITFAVVVGFIMYTWHSGLTYLTDIAFKKSPGLNKTIKKMQDLSSATKNKTTTIFIADIYDKGGGSLFQFIKLNVAPPENIVIINYCIENIPHVHSDNRFELMQLEENICKLVVHYGFMETIAIPQALHAADHRGLFSFSINVESVTYLVEIPNIIASDKKKTLWFNWQERLFVFLMRNYSANFNIEFYQLPYDRTVAIGAYYII